MYFRNFVFFLLLLLAGGSLHAQRDDRWENLIGFRFVGEAGITNCRPWQLNAALLNHHGFFSLYTVGFGISLSGEGYDYYPEDAIDPIADGWSHSPGFETGFAFHKFLANEQTITYADSSVMQYRLSGWELMTGALALNVVRNESFDVVIGYCTYWGNLKLRTANLTGQTEHKKYMNPFIAPALRTEVRFNFWKVGTGLRFSYRYDVTRDRWSSKNNDVQQIPGYRFREMQFMFYIGYYGVSEV